MTVHIPFATNSGLFDLGDLNLEMFDIEGIGAALAKINRYAGRTPQPWSVAAHSLLVYELSGRKPWALFHDAHESILGDLTAPGLNFAEAITASTDVRVGIDAAKATLDTCISAAFGVPVVDVDLEDIAACNAEMNFYFRLPYAEHELNLKASKLLLDMIKNDLTWQQWAARWIRTAKQVVG